MQTLIFYRFSSIFCIRYWLAYVRMRTNGEHHDKFNRWESKLVFWLPPLIAAPFAGSLVGVLIRRIPANRDFALARSRCESCDTQLSPIDLVPILSFIRLRGQCRACDAPISQFHLAVELAALAIVVIGACLENAAPVLWADCGLGWTLLTLAWIDARHHILPDLLTLPLVVAGLCVTAWLCPTAIVGHALGAIAGYVAFRALELAYRRVRGRDGLGQGDAKLLAAAGAWVGLASLPLLVVTASILGIVATLVLRAVLNRRLDAEIAFGPALAASLFIVRLSFHNQ